MTVNQLTIAANGQRRQLLVQATESLGLIQEVRLKKRAGEKEFFITFVRKSIVLRILAMLAKV